MGRLRVHDWESWQTYRKDRDPPPWIKVHRRIVHNVKWASLSDAERGQLLAIWVLAADDDGYIPDCPVIVRKLCMMDSEPDLWRLVDLGFLDTVTASRRQRDANVTASGGQGAVTSSHESHDDEGVSDGTGTRYEPDVNVTSSWRQHDALEAEAEAETEDISVPSELFALMRSGDTIYTVEKAYALVRAAGLSDEEVVAARRAVCEQTERRYWKALPTWLREIASGGLVRPDTSAADARKQRREYERELEARIQGDIS